MLFWLLWFPMMLSAYLGAGMFAGRLTWNRIQLASTKLKTSRYGPSYTEGRDEPTAEDKFFIILCLLFPMFAIPVHGLINLSEHISKRPTPQQKKAAAHEESKKLNRIADELNDKYTSALVPYSREVLDRERSRDFRSERTMTCGPDCDELHDAGYTRYED